MYSSVLITGGAGFIGSNLANFWKMEFPESQVSVLDNLKRRGSELNLSRLRDAGIEYIHGDIRNPEDLELGQSFDLLIECSAEPSVLAGYGQSPAYLINTNLMGTVNCLEFARKQEADLIFLSTSRVYPIKSINQLHYQEDPNRFVLAENPDVPGVSSFGFSEAFPLNGSRSLYGATKLASELIMTEYIEMYDLRGIINRCGILTGPWQMGKVDQGVIVLWMAQHLFEGALSYIGFGGLGKQVRDILHVSDLYELLKLQLKNLDQHNGKIYNVGGGLDHSLSLKELSEFCESITGKHISIESVPETRDADIPYYVSDCRKVQQATGWKPRHTLQSTLEEISAWIEQHSSLLKPILMGEKN
ncbi:MAG: NAD-dependent epimerase/dehydratase family protein [SAR324 cluster bacterium]|nr:NAD-dependent epimerase/dehydratase family protein [SAR324 cluster bacterium]